MANNSSLSEGSSDLVLTLAEASQFVDQETVGIYRLESNPFRTHRFGSGTFI
jgi:hypothetical protein